MVVIEIPDRVRTVGVLVPVDGLLKIRASRAGRVERLVVRDGDKVARGQALLRISGRQQAPGREPELVARVASLRRELGLIDEALEREVDAIAARARVNRQRALLIRERIATAKLELGTRERQAGLSEGRAQRIQSLAESRVVAEHLADEAASTALQAAAIRQSTQRLVLDLQDELLIIEQQLEHDRVLPAILRRQADIRREVIDRQIASGELLSAVEISAPDAGVISGLAVLVGEEVAPGDVLLTLHDPDARLEARLYVGTDNAGMIAAGQRVELQLKAYPHQLYGTRSAIVRTVSAAAIPAAEIDSGLSISGPVFEVRASLQENGINVRGRVWSLPPGTSFRADLVRRRWPLYRWLWWSVSGDKTYS
jgi:membrane fusion protein